MTEEHPKNQGVSTRGWVRATTIGWWLGFFVMIGMILVLDVLGLQGQFVVGLGMGVGVGYWQSRYLRGVLGRPWIWTLASGVGMALPFVAWDVSAALGAESLFSLRTAVLIGGPLVGVGQWLLLRPHGDRAIWWVPACAVGWAVPALILELGEPTNAIVAMLATALSMVGMFFGGLILGGVTARPLAWTLAAGRAEA